MKFLITAHNLTKGDGQGRINLEIVKRAAQLGHTVTLVADKVEASLLSDRVRLLPIHPRIQKPNLLKVNAFLRHSNRIVDAERANHEVIVGNGNSLTTAHHVNLCQFVNGAWGRSPVHVARLHRGPYAWYQRLYTTRNSIGEKRAYDATRFVVAPSTKIVSDLRSIGVSESKIRLIYNGVDLEEFKPGQADRTELALSEGPLALFAGDIRTPRKNLDSVLKALAIVPGLRLAVVGSTKNSPFPAMSQSLGVAARVHFLDFRTDINQIMRACDFFVFPSRYEAGSLVILEALASGLPVITAASAGGAELVTSDAGFVLEDSEDVQGLSAAMVRLTNELGLRSAQSANARAIAEQHSWTHMADEYLALFEESRLETARR